MEKITDVKSNIYDKSTIYTNCIVEVWENTVTGETSIGWYRTHDTVEISSDELEE